PSLPPHPSGEPLSEPREVLIIEGARTPFCRAGTLLADVPARELGRAAVREAIERADIAPDEIDEVIVGNIAGPHDASNVARVIALSGGVPRDVPAYTVNRNCGSALQAIADAALRIQAGEAQLVVAAGVESMSQIPVLY